MKFACEKNFCCLYSQLLLFTIIADDVDKSEFTLRVGCRRVNSETIADIDDLAQNLKSKLRRVATSSAGFARGRSPRRPFCGTRRRRAQSPPHRGPTKPSDCKRHFFLENLRRAQNWTCSKIRQHSPAFTRQMTRNFCADAAGGARKNDSLKTSGRRLRARSRLRAAAAHFAGDLLFWRQRIGQNAKEERACEADCNVDEPNRRLLDRVHHVGARKHGGRQRFRSPRALFSVRRRLQRFSAYLAAAKKQRIGGGGCCCCKATAVTRKTIYTKKIVDMRFFLSSSASFDRTRARVRTCVLMRARSPTATPPVACDRRLNEQSAHARQKLHRCVGRLRARSLDLF